MLDPLEPAPERPRSTLLRDAIIIFVIAAGLLAVFVKEAFL